MNDVQVAAEAVDWLNIVLSVAVIVLPTLFVLALTALGGTKAVEQGRKLWQSLRQTVDEPTDPIVAMIAAAVKQRPELVSNFLVALFDATFPEGVPLAERAPLPAGSEARVRDIVRREIALAAPDHSTASQSSAYAAETSALESAVSAKESAVSAREAGESAQEARNE